MNWKVKAAIQNAVSLLPSEASYDVYYWIQRRFGALRRVNPSSRLLAGIETWKRIQRQGSSPSGKVFLEVGTGPTPLVPLAYWLMGAERIITIDVNPYLKEELIAEHLHYISQHEEEVLTLFGSLIDRKRFNDMLNLARKSQLSASDFLDFCRITYLAPGDAAKTTLPDQHVDFHTSFTVFEHIPPDALNAILKEGNRITKSTGLFVHRIDYTDHFSHSDKNISAINFLRYSDDEWARYAGNKYMYMNRLRHDDFLDLFKRAGQVIVDVEPYIDQRSEELLNIGMFHVDKQFSSKSRASLAISGAWILAEKSNVQCVAPDGYSSVTSSRKMTGP
ncbi:class I SAM-dependent methyltransferase [Nitrospira sp. BLG_1]|uniref:class I SAM-dependent methyltransferase n=1 Tax=Nitrospira sp. BLG_1 TaxID=3395883 RepID=UPI0039BCA33A